MSLETTTRGAQVVNRERVDRNAESLHHSLTAGQGSDVLQHGLASVAESWCFDSADVQGSAETVDHQGGQSLALDVLCNDEEGALRLGDLLEHWNEVLHVGELLLVDEDVGVLEHALHALGRS